MRLGSWLLVLLAALALLACADRPARAPQVQRPYAYYPYPYYDPFYPWGYPDRVIVVERPAPRPRPGPPGVVPVPLPPPPVPLPPRRLLKRRP